MSATATNHAYSPSIIASIADMFALKRNARDPLGLVSGLRIHRVYSGLDAKSDAQLEEMGLCRADLPRIALETVEALQ